MKPRKGHWTFWLGDEYESEGDGRDRRILSAGQGSDGISRAEGTGVPHLLFVLVPSRGLFVPDALISDDAHKPYPDWFRRFQKVSLRDAQLLALEMLDQGSIERIHKLNHAYPWFGAAETPDVSAADLLGGIVAEALIAKDWSDS